MKEAPEKIYLNKKSEYPQKIAHYLTGVRLLPDDDYNVEYTRSDLVSSPTGGMTLQECKDKVAQGHDYKNWSELTNWMRDQDGNEVEYDECFDEAAELYAQSKLNEAQGWISKDASVPEYGIAVLIAFSNGVITIGYRTKPTEVGYSYAWQLFGDMKENLPIDASKDVVTHWKPLPPPPHK